MQKEFALRFFQQTWNSQRGNWLFFPDSLELLNTHKLRNSFEVILILVPLGDDTGLCLSGLTGELQVDPLNFCNSLRVGDDFPLASMLLDGEMGNFKPLNLVSKSTFDARNGEKEWIHEQLIYK